MMTNSPVSMQAESDASVTRSLTWRYASALALVVCLSTAAWLGLHLVITKQKARRPW